MKSKIEIYRFLVLGAVIFGLAFSTSRIPHAVYFKRFNKIKKWQTKKDIYSYYSDYLSGAKDAVEWIKKNTKENSVILFIPSPDFNAPYVARIIFPRLLLPKDSLPKGAKKYWGRRVAKAKIIGKGEGFVVLKRVNGKLYVELD